MATLNGVEFGIVNKTTTVIHDNNIIDIPGSDTVVNDDAGYSTGPMQITGHVKNESEFDDFKGEFYGGGDLTLIADPDSGKQYTVYASGNVTELDGDDTYPLSDIVFQCVFFMKYPYLESVTDVTRTKTITANNQEWSADDDGTDIKTEGNVDGVPDIQVTGVYADLSVENNYSDIGGLVGDLAWDGANMWSSDYLAQKFYKHNADMTLNTQYNSIGNGPTGITWDGANMWSCDTNTEKFYKHNADMTLNTQYNSIGVNPSGMTWDGSNIWSGDKATDKIYKHNADMTVNTTYDAPADNITGLGWDGLHIWSCDGTTGKIYMHNADMTVNTIYDGVMSGPYGPNGLTHDGTHVWSSNSAADKIYQHEPSAVYVTDVVIYNTAYTTVKCAVSNIMLTGSVYRINTGGTGTIYYDDDFNTIKWNSDSTNLNVTHDIINSELDIADDGYIYWKCEAKYPITGIPPLTSQINITAGTPTIQISSDGSTWYDIDTAIVDDVDTEYPLDSDGNLSLAGKTLFYFRFDCVKAGAATCSIKSFELDVDIHTVYAKNPVITKGDTASTFRCDQDSASGMDCEISLFYPARWWA